MRGNRADIPNMEKSFYHWNSLHEGLHNPATQLSRYSYIATEHHLAMGSMCNNYGTFVAPPGCHEVESYGGEEDTGYHHRNQEYAPSFEEGPTTSSRVEPNSTPEQGSEGRFGARFKRAIFWEMDDDRGQVGAC